MLQRIANDREREFVPRNFVFVKQPHVGRLPAGFEVEVEQLRAEEHVDLRDVRQVEDRVEPLDRDVGAGFLERFANGAVGARFTVFEKSGGQRP